MTFRQSPSHPTGFLTCSERGQLRRASWALVVSSYGLFILLFTHVFTGSFVCAFTGSTKFVVLQEFTRTRPSLQGAQSLAVSKKHTTIVEDDACHPNTVTHMGEHFVYTRLSKCFVLTKSSHQPRNPVRAVLLFPHFTDQDSEANRRFQGIHMDPRGGH